MQKNELPAKIIVALLVICIIVAGLSLLYGQATRSEITSFDECRNAGYPIILTYPEQCIADENTFVNQSQIE